MKRTTETVENLHARTLTALGFEVIRPPSSLYRLRRNGGLTLGAANTSAEAWAKAPTLRELALHLLEGMNTTRFGVEITHDKGGVNCSLVDWALGDEDGDGDWVLGDKDGDWALVSENYPTLSEAVAALFCIVVATMLLDGTQVVL